MADLRDPRWITTKAILFVLLGLLAAALILVDRPSLKVAALLGIAIWAFARAYYFAFYVIEHYIDPNYKFAGLGSAVRYLLVRRPGNRS